MEGCSAPLVVKFADTQKEKDAKRIQTIQTNLWNFTGMNSPMAPSPVPVASPIHSNPPAHSSPFMTSDALPTNTSLQLLQQIQAFGLQQQLLHGKLKLSRFVSLRSRVALVSLSSRIGGSTATAAAAATTSAATATRAECSIINGSKYFGSSSSRLIRSNFCTESTDAGRYDSAGTNERRS